MAERSPSVLGADLAMTRYVGTASAVPLEAADSWGSLDLSVEPAASGGRAAAARSVRDLRRVEGRASLAQALILRLLTPRGSLAALGHPAYGSRLVDLVGRRNDATARNLARMYTLEALQAEPRVQEVLDLAVTTAPDRPDALRISFRVLPVGEGEPIALGLEVEL